MYHGKSRKPWYIYALCDPISSEVRYIGKSVDPEFRLECHIQEASEGCKTFKSNWIRWLFKHNLKPSLRILDLGYGESWIEAEKFYIKFYREEVGANLTNYTEGGDTPTGWRHHPETIQKLRDRKAHVSKETRSKMSRSAKLRGISEETKAKISATEKGRVFSDSTRSKLSAAAISRGSRPEERTKMSIAQYLRHRTVDSEILRLEPELVLDLLRLRLV